jgi:hypothetical protein
MTGLANMFSGISRLVCGTTKAFWGLGQDSLTVAGFALACLILAFSARPDLRVAGEGWLVGWLQGRQVGPVVEIAPVADLSASERATAIDPKELPPSQANLAQWISKKYRVAPEAVAALVAEAHVIGTRAKLEPTLILAIAAIESGFNPFSQSPNGAQGLMQVMTRVHADKFAGFGGNLAAFDPIANLRVGVKILQDCISRAGSIEGGLRFYVGASTIEDGGYADKVLAEQARLDQVARAPTRRAPLR